jgi:translocon-associated protein subunit alpha
MESLVAYVQNVVMYVSERRLVAWAEDDDTDDEIVDVEGEADESAIIEEGGEDDETQPRASPDADTTILFTRPVVSGVGASGNLGWCIMI